MQLDEELEELVKKAKKDHYLLSTDVKFEKGSKYYKLLKEKLSDINIDIISKDRIDLPDSVDIEILSKDNSLLEDKIDINKFDRLDELPTKIKIDDPVRMYLKEIIKYPLLTLDEESNLTRKTFEGKEASKIIDNLEECDVLSETERENYEDKILEGEIAKEKIFNSNLRLVVSVAKKYIGRGLDFLDLIQEGSMGLLKSIDMFDYRKGNKLSTYATYWIRQAISRALADQSRTIRIPVHMVETRNKIFKAKRELTKTLYRDPSPAEIADFLGLTVKKVNEGLSVGQRTISLETKVGTEEESTLEDFIADESSLNPYQNQKRIKLHEALDEALSLLTDREQYVIRLRFGYDDGEKHTLEEIGVNLGITRERVRQIEAKAKQKLSRPSSRKKLEAFLDK